MSDGTHRYLPSLGDVTTQVAVPVSKWWDQVVFVQGPARLTRKKIVLSAANQDGGAHVDDKLSADYQSLAADGFVGKVLHTIGGQTTTNLITGAHFVALRQMAFELLNSPALVIEAA